MPSLWKFGGITPLSLIKLATHKLGEDELSTRAASLSYYFLLALFPLFFLDRCVRRTQLAVAGKHCFGVGSLSAGIGFGAGSQRCPSDFQIQQRYKTGSWNLGCSVGSLRRHERCGCFTEQNLSSS